MIEWNHDMSAAPRGVTRVELTKAGKEIEVFEKEYVLAVDRHGKVFQSAYIPPKYTKAGNLLEGDRWSAFSRDFPPIAWAEWPKYDLASAAEGVVSHIGIGETNV